MSKPLPNQVNVYTAAEVTRSASGTDEERWGISSCLSTTKAGDRSVIYQSGSDAGIVSLFDFATDAAAHPDLKFVAWGKEILLDTPTPRAELLADPKLASVFRSIQGRRALPADAAAALEEMLGGLPDFSGPEGPAPADFETWRWSPAGKGHTWGNEEAMQQAIAEQEPAWTRLGFDGAPQREVHPPGSRDEIDLYGPGMIGECKLLAEARDLAQLDRYLEPLNRDAAHLSPAGRWHGLLIAAHGYSRELATAIAERPDVQLLVCLRGPHDEATFVEVTDPDQAPPDLEAQPTGGS